MALTSEDIAVISGMDKGMTPYESFMVSEKTSKRASNTAIAAVVVGSVGAALAIGAWIFGPVMGTQQYKGNQKSIDILANSLLAERSERVATANTQWPTINDYIKLSQTQSGSQQTSAVNSAYAQAEAQILANALTGQSQICPKPVTIYSAPQPCGCSGCGA